MRTDKFIFKGLLYLTKLFRRNIKYKLFVIFMIIIAIPTLLTGIIFFKMSSTVVEKDFIKYKSQLIENVSRRIDENMNSLIRQSMAIYNNPDDILYVLNPDTTDSYSSSLDSYKRMSDFFQSVMQSNDNIDSIALFSIAGDVKYYINKLGGTLNFDNVRNKAWFLDTIAQKGSTLLTEPHFNDYVQDKEISKIPVISISRVVLDLQSDKNAMRGVLSIDQDVNKFKQLLSNVISEKNEIITVLGQSNSIVYTNKPISKADYTKLISMMNENSGFSTNSFNFTSNGQPLLATFFESPEHHWKILSLLPIAELQKKSLFLKNINNTLFIILSFVAFIISITFSLLITTPLNKLMYSFRKVQRGDFNTKIAVKGEDELSLIGKTFNKMVEDIRNLIEQKYEMTIFRNQAELKALQNQINPHFLYNTLTSIKAVIDKKDHAFASIMVEHLSDIFRYNLGKVVHAVPFREELEYIRKYLFLQKCRFSDKFEVYYDIDEEVLDFTILRLTLQPIVENALYHGLEPKFGKGDVKIVAKRFNEHFYIYITDDGVGIPLERLVELNSQLEQNTELDQNSKSDHDSKSGQVGIHNVNSRIKYYFGANYGLKITSISGSCTTVKITLPAQEFT